MSHERYGITRARKISLLEKYLYHENVWAHDSGSDVRRSSRVYWNLCSRWITKCTKRTNTLSAKNTYVSQYPVYFIYYGGFYLH